jgi:hypothetical protein
MAVMNQRPTGLDSAQAGAHTGQKSRPRPTLRPGRGGGRRARLGQAGFRLAVRRQEGKAVGYAGLRAEMEEFLRILVFSIFQKQCYIILNQIRIEFSHETAVQNLSNNIFCSVNRKLLLKIIIMRILLMFLLRT